MKWSSLALALAALAAALAAAAVADVVYFANGYSASWYATVGEERVLIDETTEHRVYFPNAHRPLARYVQGWPADRYPIPVGVPRVDAVLRARIEIPGQVPMRLGADAIERAAIWADGEPLEDRALAPGAHDLWIRWEAEPAPHARGARGSDTAAFRLLWGSGERAEAPVPARALRPADGGGTARAVLWFVALVLGLLLALGLYRADTTEEEPARQARFGLVLVAALVVLGAGVRGYDYDVMPEYRENLDELFATWNGWSLLDDGTTRGWTIWASAYRGRVEMIEERFFGQQANVVSPYFEHPPLMHVLVGAAAHLGGAHHYLHAKLWHTRLVPIGLMALGTVLLIAVGRRLWPGSVAPYVGALFFGTIPTIVLQTRVIKEEDVLVPLLLGAVLFFLRWRDDGRRTRDLVGAAICVGLAPLAKVPAAALIVGVAMLFAAERGGLRPALRVLGLGVGIGSLLVLYGLVIDFDEFVFAFRLQSGRAIHWNLFPRFFDVGQINGNRVGRGWTIFLWLAYAATIYARGLRSSAVLTVPALVYLVAIAIGSGNWTYGWYVVPLYPFLCLAAGDLVVRTWHRPTLFAGLLFVGLLLFYTLNFTLHPTWIRQASTWPQIRAVVTAATLVGLAPFALAEVWRRHAAVVRLAQVALVAIVGLAAALGAWTVAHYDVLYETHNELDVDDWFAR
ncbi:MAG: hypothetical protein KF729_08660 [Sandaracinaceae bacterium]|nr:hypothetical protein [Sandaracinaceae bacterium]